MRFIRNIFYTLARCFPGPDIEGRRMTLQVSPQSNTSEVGEMLIYLAPIFDIYPHNGYFRYVSAGTDRFRPALLILKTTTKKPEKRPEKIDTLFLRRRHKKISSSPFSRESPRYLPQVVSIKRQ